MRMVMSEVKKGPKDAQAQQQEEAGVLRPALFPGLNVDVESMILDYAGIESVVTLSLLSRAAYEFIRTRPAEYYSLLPSMLQGYFKQKRGGRALAVVPASFSERPFQVIMGMLSQSSIVSSEPLEGHTS